MYSIATSCWCIMVDIPKPGVDNPNGKYFGDVVEYNLQLEPCPSYF